jgi:hypothetical protein
MMFFSLFAGTLDCRTRLPLEVFDGAYVEVNPIFLGMNIRLGRSRDGNIASLGTRRQRDEANLCEGVYGRRMTRTMIFKQTRPRP